MRRKNTYCRSKSCQGWLYKIKSLWLAKGLVNDGWEKYLAFLGLVLQFKGWKIGTTFVVIPSTLWSLGFHTYSRWWNLVFVLLFSSFSLFIFSNLFLASVCLLFFLFPYFHRPTFVSMIVEIKEGLTVFYFGLAREIKVLNLLISWKIRTIDRNEP